MPGSVRPLLAMVRLVRECQASETLPLLVHCSAGCGRTGTICAIDHVWTLMRTGVSAICAIITVGKVCEKYPEKGRDVYSALQGL